ncbi:MAG: PKD domain-containing protein [Chlorobiales bacterium]|nr:PKD domain-containing protein [Chlorobiales bacterium]
MKCTALSLRTVCFLVVVLGVIHSVQALELSGRCYSGTKPDQSTELQGVDLTLYGAASAGGARDQLDTYTTGSSQPNGWYKLTIVEGYEHYFIEASTPSGYTFDDASSVDGTVSGNEIHYSTESAPLENQTLTGNKFWFIPDTPDNNPPVADADGPYMGQLSQTITLDGSGSYDPDPGDSIVSYEWDLDNNGQYNDATGVNHSWLWNSVGTHTIGLRVTDQSGETDTDTSTVTIEEGEPETGVLEGYKRDADTGQGLAGWRIYIDLNGNGQWDGSEPSAETDGSGFYHIPNVEPGTYRVCEVMQPGWQSEAPCIDGVSIVADTTTTQDFHNRREGGGRRSMTSAMRRTRPIPRFWPRTVHVIPSIRMSFWACVSMASQTANPQPMPKATITTVWMMKTAWSLPRP